MWNSEAFLKQFQTFSLTTGDLVGVIFLTAAFYIILLAYARTRVFNRKKLAHCLTLVNASLMCVFSLIYMSVKFKMGNNVFDFYGGEVDWWIGRDNFSAVVLVMFGTANVMDIMLGLVFYKDHLPLLTTWIHHSVYVWLMVLLVTGNGYIASLPTPYTPAFMYALLEELPTLILAAGTVFPQHRQDLAFGISFLVTRIIFHAYMFAYMFRVEAPFVILASYTCTLLLHSHWFYGWVTKYAFDHHKMAIKAKEL